MTDSTRGNIDEREARKRFRERIIIIATIILIVALSFIESQISSKESILPISDNVLIFGLININIILIILLLFLIIRNVVKLIYERRHGVIGSKLRTKLVAAFVSLSLIPTVILFLISINFLSYSIENWFNLKIGDALNQTVEVAQLYYQQTADYAKYYARQMASDVSTSRLYEKDKTVYLKALIEQRQKNYNLGMIEVYFDNQREKLVVYDRNDRNLAVMPLLPNVLEDVFSGKEVSTIQASGNGDFIRGAAPIYIQGGAKEVIGVVVVGYFIPKVMVDKIAVVSKASEQYKQISLLKNPIKFSYMITLFAVTLLIIFCATWFGLFLAQGIIVPIQDLAEATRKIARGNLDHRINIVANDEIGVLVDSFNQMTQDLKNSNEGLEQANIDLERRRKYMETVLRDVSAGVISTDQRGVITTINRAAERMLGIDTDKILNHRYEDVLSLEYMALVNELLLEMKESGQGFIEKQIELALSDKVLNILMTATTILDDEGDDMGIVVVFEDLTQLQKAERAAAWREVARRMAHEIKNPLTPIQLSAQRLQKKYGDKLADDGDIFHECTRTIVDQVEVLKNLVNAFSQYARMPATNPLPNDLNAVINDPIILFQDAHKDITFEFKQDKEIPKLNIDAEKLNRVMINLLDNAVAAMDKTGGRVEITTSYDPAARKVKVEVADNGCGVPHRYKMKIFEPYFSTKKSGTGLGLAIVTSIISDHQGRVEVRDNDPAGTIVAFELPVPEL